MEDWIKYDEYKEVYKREPIKTPLSGFIIPGKFDDKTIYIYIRSFFADEDEKNV